MKTLVESLFGDNVKNTVNTSDLKTASDLLAQSLESKLKMDCLTINGSHKDPDIWEDGWYLCRVSTDDSTEVIYLQNTIDVVEAYNNLTISLRMQVNLQRNDDDLYVDFLGIDVFEEFNYFIGYHVTGPQTFKQWTDLRDAHCTTNFEGILKYITNTFWTFKQLAEHGMTFEEVKKKTKEHYFCKNSRKRRTIEDEATKELMKTVKMVIK